MLMLNCYTARVLSYDYYFMLESIRVYGNMIDGIQDTNAYGKCIIV